MEEISKLKELIDYYTKERDKCGSYGINGFCGSEYHYNLFNDKLRDAERNLKDTMELDIGIKDHNEILANQNRRIWI